MQDYVVKDGNNPDDYLFMGRKVTQTCKIRIESANNGYEVFLSANANNQLYIASDNAILLKNYAATHTDWVNTASSNVLESDIMTKNTNIIRYTKPILTSFKIYHFHDTGKNSPIITPCNIGDNLVFKENGHNIAPFLKMLKDNYIKSYNRILDVVKIALPFFKDFHFRDKENIDLEWFQTGDSETPLKGKLLSDGSLRFICLCVALLQPFELMPRVIIIDEPELGLHPVAIHLLSELIKRVSKKKQVIISTQSAELLNYFEPKDVITVSRKNGESILQRLSNNDFEIWLEDYSLGQIWSNNILDDNK